MRRLLSFLLIWLVALTGVALWLNVERVESQTAAPQTVTRNSSIPFTATWQTEIVDNSGSVGLKASLATDSNGFPHISYEDFIATLAQRLKYAYWDGAGWISQTVSISSNLGTADVTSLVIDDNDHPRISYQQSVPLFRLQYSKWDGNQWLLSTPVNNGVNGTQSSLALDSNDNAHISHIDNNGQGLLYTYWNTLDWVTEIPVAGPANYAALALDSNDRPHIIYWHPGDFSLNYVYWDGVGWNQSPITQIGDSNFTSALSLAIDTNDNLHISYANAVDNHLHYAYFNGSGWNFQMVAPLNPLSWHNDLVLADDEPLISYHDYANGLMVATLTASGWATTVVDSSPDVGRYNSIALDINERPLIAYYDATNTALKLARQGVSQVVNSGGGTFEPTAGVTVTFPVGTFSEDVIVSYTGFEPTGTLPHVGVFYEMAAQSRATGDPSDPLLPYSLELAYDEEQLAVCAEETSISLFRWDGKTGLWGGKTGFTIFPDEDMGTGTSMETGVFALLAPPCSIHLPLILRP